MHIVYYDESGDDGYPKYSSDFFVLSAIYMHYLSWHNNFEQTKQFRREIRDQYRIPIKWEIHTKYLLLNKKPYRKLGLSTKDRLRIMDAFCDLIGKLDLRIINVVIVKPRIHYHGYKVLDTALKYSVQRIENDLKSEPSPDHRFLIITDPGRVGKMRTTTRRIQRFNPIPSKFGTHSYRQEIEYLIEDPLPKDSKESYFIQIADALSYLIYLHSISQTQIGQFSNRLSQILTPEMVRDWIDKLKPSLNCKASSRDPYGIVYHPAR
jgi:predicted P-loop ATPase/GTPase